MTYRLLADRGAHRGTTIRYSGTLTCMTASAEALKQLNTLLAEHAELVKRARYPDLSDLGSEVRVLANRLQAAIDRLTVPTSTHARAAEMQRANQEPTWRLEELMGIAIALRDDIVAGWLTSVIELVHADTYNDYLEMAEGLHGQGYKDPAAVIAGTSLEVHLRTLASKHGISLQAANGSPKKADTINADLKAAGVYSGLELKQVTAWLHLRNSAAHGSYSDYADTDVKQLIDGVCSFASKYPA